MNSRKTASPVPPASNEVVAQGMTFPQAMEKVIAGQKITRLEWGNLGGKDDYCFLGTIYLSIVRNGNEHTWQVNDGDMKATDWVLYSKAN